MAQPFKVQYDDFGGGLSIRYAAHLIQKNEAVTAKNVDLQDRYLQGLKDLGSSVATPGLTGPKWIWYSPAGAWIDGDYALETRFAVNDGAKVYATRESQRPIAVTPTQSYSLGIVPPAGLATNYSYPGSKYGAYKYAITFVTADGLESNPQDFDLTISLVDPSTGAPTTGDIQLYDIPTSNDPRVVARRIYRSLANSQAMYFLYEIPDNSTSYTSGSPWADVYGDTQLDLTRPLTWSDGGFPSSGGIYVEDHSVPVTLTVLSTGIHSANGSVGRSGSGILFGAIGSTVYWSALGFPDYWPTVNQFSLAENVESIVSYGGATFVFTPNFIYQARGDSDDTITWNRTSAAFGVRKGYGRFTTPTAQGILFFAQDGLAVFDGSSARLVAENKLPRGYFDSLTINAVGFFRNRFHVFTNTAGDTATLIFDFRDGIGNPIITSSTHLISAAHVANYAEPVTAEVLPPSPSTINQVKVANPGSYKVVSSGTGYGVSLSVTAAPSGGTSATASGLFGVDRIAVANGGSSYTSVPTVEFTTPDGGRAAKGVATIAGGKVISITITDSGAGYTSTEMSSIGTFGPAILTLVGGGGSGASFDLYSKFTGVQISNSGAGYTQIPSVTASIASPGTVSVDAQLFAELSPELYIDAGLVAISNVLYRLGGSQLKSPNPNTTTVTSIDKYDLSTSGWSRSSAVYPQAVRGFSTVSNNGATAYAAGGTTGTTFSAATSKKLYSFNGSAFTTLTDMPDEKSFGALVSDASGNLYDICGVSVSGTLSATLYKYTTSTNTWGSSMSLLVGVNLYYLAYHRAVVVDNKIYIFGGLVNVNNNSIGGATLNSNVFIWDIANSTASIDSTGPTYGWTGRQMLQAVAYNGKVYLFGGSAGSSLDTGAALSDLWIYDPNSSPKWSCRTSEVINASARTRAGVALISGNMYTYGGITTYARYSADGLRIQLDQASDCSGTPGLYVIETTGTGVKLFEGGNRMSDWVWEGRREIGPIPGPKMTWMRARAMVNDSVSIGARFQDGASSSVWDIYNTTSAGTTGLGTQVRFWFPSRANGASNPVPIGQWIGLRLKAANSSTTAQVYRVEIDAKMDTDGG